MAVGESGGASGSASGSASSGASGGKSSRWVHVCVVVRVPGRQRGRVQVRGCVQVPERIIIRASGQAAEAGRKSRDKIKLG